MYKKENLEKLSDYRYTALEKIDKKVTSIFYTSYTSKLEDVHTKTLEKLRKHKDTIDFAIKYIRGQMIRGIKQYNLLVFPQELNKDYQYYIYQYVKAELEKEHNKCQTHKSRQPYWVYDKFIQEYMFRDGKDLKSKYQCFIEFIPSYSKTDCIKLNLAMNKHGYENRDKIYLDGFDIVYDNFDKDIKIRHISERKVQNKEDNGIEKHICIDSWGNIYQAVYDKNSENVNDKGQLRFNPDRKIAVGDVSIIRNTKTMRSLLDYLSNFYNRNETNLFKGRLYRLQEGFKTKLRQVINSNNESKVSILIHSDFESNIFKFFTKVFLHETESLCSKYGIRLEVIVKTKNEIENSIKDYKNKANDWNKKRNGYGLSYSQEQIEHSKWFEQLIPLFECQYKEFFVMLSRSRKSSKNYRKATDENDNQVLEKPNYPSFDNFKEQYKTWCNDFPDTYKIEDVRFWFVETVKSLAQEFYSKSFITEESNEIVFV